MMGRQTFCGVGLVLLVLLLGLHQGAFAEERYAVKPGDTLSGISKKFGLTVEVLREANGLKGNGIKPKQTLVIPTESRKSSAKGIKKQSGQTMNSVRTSSGALNPAGTVPKTNLAAEQLGVASNGVKTPLGQKDSYIVQKGDSLHTIAKRVGLSVEEIKHMSQLRSASLKVGQTLMLSRQKPLQEENEEEIGDVEEVTIEQVTEKGGERQETSDLLGTWTNPEERSLLVRVAKTFLGAPYRLGGSTLRGIDCSAFVRRIYEVFSIDLPRTTREQLGIGKRVGKDELEEGDLVFFKTRAPRANNAHVGIYIGNNEFVHASSRKKEVKVDNLNSPYFSSHFFRGVRVKELEREFKL